MTTQPLRISILGAWPCYWKQWSWRSASRTSDGAAATLASVGAMIAMLVVPLFLFLFDGLRGDLHAIVLEYELFLSGRKRSGSVQTILRTGADGQLRMGKPVGPVLQAGLAAIRRLLVGHLDV